MGQLIVNLELKEQPFVLQLKNEEQLEVILDASPAIGGQEKGMRPMELLAGSLAGCMSIDVLNILRKQRLEVTTFKVAIKANRVEAVPARFDEITLEFITDTAVPLAKLENAVKLSHEKYCSVSASLDPAIRITTTCKHDN